MRKIIQFGFIALFAYQLIGFFAFFEFEHYLIRKQIKKAIKLSVPENQLIQFHFTVKESAKLHWVKPHEFRLNGRFYDVVYKTKSKGVWYFKCINDIQETALFATLNTACAENLSNTPPSHPLQGWLKVLKEPMEEISKNEFINIEIVQFQKREVLPNDLYINYLDPYLAHSFPPPDFM